MKIVSWRNVQCTDKGSRNYSWIQKWIIADIPFRLLNQPYLITPPGKMPTSRSAYFIIRVLSHRRDAITRCVNAIRGNKNLINFNVYSHCTRNAEVWTKYKNVHMVLIFTVIALTHRVIASRLCERALRSDTVRHVPTKQMNNKRARFIIFKKMGKLLGQTKQNNT